MKRLPLPSAHTQKAVDLGLCTLIGAAVFLLLYGPAILDPTYDHWILNGLPEADIIQHYAGWMAYRQSPWAWPLGLMQGLGGTTVTFTDSIPFVSILFKFFDPILPEIFQFFGLYTLACLMLQGLAAGLLVGLYTERRGILCFGALLFCLSPVMLERALRHTALASHYLILFSLYLLLYSRRSGRFSCGWYILALLAMGTHPYFLPMVFGLMLANLAELCLAKKRPDWRGILIFFTSIAVSALFGYAIGALGGGVSLVSGDQPYSGFGYYSMNLNAPFNPTSLGFRWSRFLPVLPQREGQYDGFNYLGLGFLLAIPFCLAGLAKRFFRGDRAALKRAAGRNVVLFFLCITLTCFSLSNVVTLNGKVLFEYPLPEFILNLCAIFRASSRLFYPVFYLVMLWVIRCLCSCRRWGLLLAALLSVVQVTDLSPVLIAKHRMYRREAIEAQFLSDPFYNDPAWKQLSAEFDAIKMLDTAWDYRLAAFAGRCGSPPDISISRGGRSALWLAYRDGLSSITQGPVPDKTAYLLPADNPSAMALNSFLPGGTAMYDLGSYYAIVSASHPLAADPVSRPASKTIYAADLTDEIWADGVHRDGVSGILFPSTLFHGMFLQPGRILRAGESAVTIKELQLYNNGSGEMLWVSFEEPAPLDDFRYPAVILFE